MGANYTCQPEEDMPRGDGRDPMGKVPDTGCGGGFCLPEKSGESKPGKIGEAFGDGEGR